MKWLIIMAYILFLLAGFQSSIESARWSPIWPAIEEEAIGTGKGEGSGVETGQSTHDDWIG